MRLELRARRLTRFIGIGHDEAARGGGLGREAKAELFHLVVDHRVFDRDEIESRRLNSGRGHPCSFQRIKFGDDAPGEPDLE